MNISSQASQKSKMKATLTETIPTREIERLNLRNSLDTVLARATVRQLADSLGYSLVDQVHISTVIFELARDIINYAGQGEIVVIWREDDSPHKGLEFFCNDHGLDAPGLTAVLQTAGHKSDDKLNVLDLRKLMDKFEVSEDNRYGNCVTLAKWIE